MLTNTLAYYILIIFDEINDRRINIINRLLKKDGIIGASAKTQIENKKNRPTYFRMC